MAVYAPDCMGFPPGSRAISSAPAERGTAGPQLHIHLHIRTYPAPPPPRPPQIFLGGHFSTPLLLVKML